MSDTEESSRIRKLTEKGHAYNMDVKVKRIKRLFKQLQRAYENINAKMKTGTHYKEEADTVRNDYAKWLEDYDELYETRFELEGILTTDAEITYFERERDIQDNILKVMKMELEAYVQRSHSQPQQTEEDLEKLMSRSVASVASDRSITCRISSVQLRENQRIAEIIAKTGALKERQKLELEKLKLKMREDELKLATELRISEAKMKAVAEFDVDQAVEHKTQEHHTYSPDSNQAIDAVVKQLRKPVPEIHKFSGNPTDYAKFMRQFRVKIVANTDDDDERTSYLEQFTIGEAHQVVSSFSYLDSAVGYLAALKELRLRYGNEETIATAFVKRALGWPVVKPDDAKALVQYAIFLNECENAAANIDAVKGLEYPDNVRKLVAKLPFHLHDKWRNEVLKTKDRSQSVKFSQLVKFVKWEARKATDPVYGRDALKMEQTMHKAYSPMTRPQIKKSYATDLVENKPESKVKYSNTKYYEKEPRRDNKITQHNTQCTYCKGLHPLKNCENICSLPHTDKINFLRSQGLCFRCLVRGHISSNCNRFAKCNVCNRAHQTILHIQQQGGSQTYRKEACLDAVSTLNMSTGVGDSKTTMAVIPVKVKMTNSLRVVETYAFLDPGSSISFCSTSLMKKLDCSGKPMKITIDTMGSPHTMDTTIIQGLQVCDLGLDNMVTLPPVYTKDHLPLSRSHIPTADDVSQYPHLQDIELPQIDCDIELLIGNNVPDAYKNRQIREPACNKDPIRLDPVECDETIRRRG